MGTWDKQCTSKIIAIIVLKHLANHESFNSNIPMIILSCFCHSSPGGAGGCHFDRFDQIPDILRPPSMNTTNAAAAVTNIRCPFCQVNFCPGQRPLDEQLVDHILTTSCGPLHDRQWLTDCTPILMASFLHEPGVASFLLVYFLHLFWKRTF